jgi:hypothetical protein
MTEATPASTNTEQFLTLGWGPAAELLKPFGTVAANFSEAIRLLVSTHINGTQFSHGSRNHLIRLLKNDTLKATYYFFSRQFNPGLLTSKKHLTPGDFVDAYKPLDHAAVLTLCYLFKNLSKKIEKEEWDYVQTPLYEALAIGGKIGLTVKEVGLGIGLMTRGLRYLAFAPLMRENRKAFKEYRLHLKTNDKVFDLAFEQRVWQCSTVQITGLMLEQMGFPRSVALQFVAAAERSESSTPDQGFGVPFRLAECLMDAYMEGQEIPTTTPAWVGQSIELPAEVRGNLLMSLKGVSSESNRVEWLNKGSADVSPTNTPELFVPTEEPHPNP